MPANVQRSGQWLVLLTLIAIFAAIVILAPGERSLGDLIRLVYVHVAFTRAGMFGFYAAGILGVAVMLSAAARLQSWTQTIVWVSFTLFLLGGLVSLVAQQASWGGILWDEPRNRTSLTVVAVAVIILLGANWVPSVRVQGMLYVLLAAYVAWIIPRTPLILHPGGAGSASPSLWIRLTFPSLTALVFLLGMWLVWYIEKPKLS